MDKLYELLTRNMHSLLEEWLDQGVPLGTASGITLGVALGLCQGAGSSEEDVIEVVRASYKKSREEDAKRTVQ